jgi:hypothetical protein
MAEKRKPREEGKWLKGALTTPCYLSAGRMPSPGGIRVIV